VDVGVMRRVAVRAAPVEVRLWQGRVRLELLSAAFKVGIMIHEYSFGVKEYSL